MRWLGFVVAFCIVGPAFAQGPEEVEGLKRRVRELELEIRKAKDLGQPDRAEALAREAERARGRLEELVRARRGPGPEDERAAEVERLKGRLRELEGAMREAKELGQRERAQDVAREIEGVNARLRELKRAVAQGPGPGPKDAEEMVNRAARLRMEALRAKREGQVERARDLWAEASRIEAELGEASGLGPAGPRPVVAGPRPEVPGPRPAPVVGPPPDEIRGEIDRLRAEVRELRALLDRALRDRPRGEPEPRREREEPRRDRPEGDG